MIWASKVRLKALCDTRDAMCPKCRSGVATIAEDPAGWGWEHHEDLQRTKCRATQIRVIIFNEFSPWAECPPVE